MVLEAEIPTTRELVRDLIDLGTVGNIVGLPFSGKSRLTHEVIFKTAAGCGLVLGRFEVVNPGPVVAVWQDDSTANELERIQEYHRRHDYPNDLPIRWLLNEGIKLPDDLGSLAEIVRRDGAVLLAVDSLYNVLGAEVGRKDEDVAIVLAQTKEAICDTTGATVLIVDHSPWPTEGNRGQRRPYGSVFKAAAVRWSVHLERNGDGIHIEAIANNLRGLQRTAAQFDEETLDLRLADSETPALTLEGAVEDVLAWLVASPGWHSTSALREAITARGVLIDEALRHLLDEGAAQLSVVRAGNPVESVVPEQWDDWAKRRVPKYWQASIHADPESSQTLWTTEDDVPAQPISKGESSRVEAPRRGDDSRDDYARGAEPSLDDALLDPALFEEHLAPWGHLLGATSVCRSSLPFSEIAGSQ